MKNLLKLSPIRLSHSVETHLIDTGIPLTTPSFGLYAGALEENDSLIMWRDPLGSHKLFYGKTPKNEWCLANRIHTLMHAGVLLGDIRSCPAGQIVRANGKKVDVLKRYSPTLLGEDRSLDTSNLHNAVRTRLNEAFEVLAQDFQGARFVVCLSGGLDSSIIATWASRYLPGAVACSFSFINNSFDSNKTGLSEDFLGAKRIADALSLPFIPILRSREAVMSALPEAVILGQDWRDFNAHCSVINLFISQSIRATFPDEQIVVLTGDLMNEYVCDYREEIIDRMVYYPQPKISLGRRRRFFVKGLDAGDREVGVFSAFGIKLVQPFAAAADLYLQLPAHLLEAADIKIELNGPLLPAEVLRCVNISKTRAQVGGKDGGVLGICHRAGIDQNKLKEIWANSFPEAPKEETLKLIEFGAYRT